MAHSTNMLFSIEPFVVFYSYWAVVFRLGSSLFLRWATPIAIVCRPFRAEVYARTLYITLVVVIWLAALKGRYIQRRAKPCDIRKINDARTALKGRYNKVKGLL